LGSLRLSGAGLRSFLRWRLRGLNWGLRRLAAGLASGRISFGSKNGHFVCLSC
jgi:hypothetical protein